MSASVKFSDVCGENIEISADKTTATWVPKNSCGWACSEAELKPGDVTIVKVDGSGRCDIGFMKGEQSPSTFKTLHEIRANRKMCSIEITYKENEISSNFGDRTFKKIVKHETKVWVAIFIRYGGMVVDLLTNCHPQSKMTFSSTKHGANIKLENDNTTASSISKNPASICFVSERLHIGGTYCFKCTTEKEGDRQPIRYELKLHVCQNDPKLLKKDFKYLFEASEIQRGDAPLTTIEIIEKDECNGDVTIKLSDSNTVQYKTARGKQNTQGLSFTTQNGIWVVLELYRVKVQTVDFEETSGTDEVSYGTNVDLLDSLSPINTTVTAVQPENSDMERHLNQAEGGSEELVRRLTGRVISLEQELQNLRTQTQISSRSVPRVASCPDMNIYIGTIGEELNVQRRFPDLVREIDTMAFCDHLYAKDIITNGQMESIHATYNQRGATDANRELLKVMKTKRITKSVMIEIVEETQQQHLLEMFYPPKH